MPSRTLKDASVHELADELRSRGCAVVLWQAADIVDRVGGDENMAWDLLRRISRVLCDRMTEVGWEVIDEEIPDTEDVHGKE